MSKLFLFNLMNVSIVNCLNLPCFAQIAQKFITYCFTVMLIKLLSFSLLSCGQNCNLCTTNSFVYVCLFYELVPNLSLCLNISLLGQRRDSCLGTLTRTCDICREDEGYSVARAAPSSRMFLFRSPAAAL